MAARLLDRYARSTNTHHLFVAVRNSSFFPAAGADPRRFVEMMTRAIALSPRGQGTRMQWETLALAHLRAGEWRASLDALRIADGLAGDFAGTPAERSFLRAMAHWRLGEEDIARTHFDAGLKWMAQTPRPKGVTVTMWRDAEVFRAEATALIAREVAPPPHRVGR
jgi:hypothetical protein